LAGLLKLKEAELVYLMKTTSDYYGVKWPETVKNNCFTRHRFRYADCMKFITEVEQAKKISTQIVDPRGNEKTTYPGSASHSIHPAEPDLYCFLWVFPCCGG